MSRRKHRPDDEPEEPVLPGPEPKDEPEPQFDPYRAEPEPELEGPPPAELFEPPPPEPAAEPEPPTPGVYRVRLPGVRPLQGGVAQDHLDVEAGTPEEAWERFKEANGITATEHRPEISRLPGPE